MTNRELLSKNGNGRFGSLKFGQFLEHIDEPHPLEKVLAPYCGSVVCLNHPKEH
jgi:hypothetical protein